MHAVVKDVKGESAADDSIGDGFREDEVGELGERRLEHEEEGRGHD